MGPSYAKWDLAHIQNMTTKCGKFKNYSLFLRDHLWGIKKQVQSLGITPMREGHITQKNHEHRGRTIQGVV